MANASPAFRALQAGIESVRGTEVNATVILGGLTDLRWGPTYDSQQVPELDGSMSEARDDAELLGKSGMVHPTVMLSFEDLPYWLGMAYAAAATSTGDGGSPPMYSRTYSAGLSALNDPATLTLEPYVDTEEWVGTYGMLADFTMTLPKRGFTTLEGNVLLKDLTQAAKTAALTRRTQRRIKGGNWTYTFDVASAIGTTPVTDCVEGASLASGPLYDAETCQDGTLFLSGHKQLGVKPQLTFTVKAGPQSIAAFYTAYTAGSLCRMRLTNTGTIIHDAVTRKVVIDITGNLLTYPEAQGNSEGSMTRAFVLVGAEDSTTSRVIHWTVQNSIASLVSGA